jgi:hypothetical protein
MPFAVQFSYEIFFCNSMFVAEDFSKLISCFVTVMGFAYEIYAF